MLNLILDLDTRIKHEYRILKKMIIAYLVKSSFYISGAKTFLVENVLLNEVTQMLHLSC